MLNEIYLTSNKDILFLFSLYISNKAFLSVFSISSLSVL